MAKKNDYTAKSYKSTLKKPAISSGIMAETLDEHLRKEKPGDFKYTPKKPTWNYNDKALRSVYEQIMNRKDFSFDVNESALYNQYKDMYQKQGQMAMMDTMGQAAAMSGGYGNSYAAAAGMQAYQQNLDKLTEKVPELYQLAMQQYQLEGQNLQDKYNAGYSERDMAYGQYRDSVDDYYSDRDFAYDQHRDAVDDYQWGSDFYSGLYQDAVKNEQDFAAYNLDVASHNLDVAEHNAGLEQWRQEFGLKQDEFDYSKERDKVKDQQWQQEFEHLKYMDGEELKQWAAEHGLDVKELDHLISMDEWEKDQAGRSG